MIQNSILALENLEIAIREVRDNYAPDPPPLEVQVALIHIEESLQKPFKDPKQMRLF